MLRFGSLFAGIGGFDRGLELSGMKCVWQVEINNHCNTVLSHHWPDVNRFGDVNDVGRRNLKPVDLICGGFPCQGLSVAGQRAGLADDRSGLWYEFARIIEELAPRWVVIENVPGLLSSNEGRDMGIIVGTLGKFGYGYAWATLDAQYFGVAQRRRRVFIVGCLGDWISSAEILFESESGAGHSPPRREKGARSTRPTSDSSGNSRGTLTPWDVESKRIHHESGPAPTLYAEDSGGQRTPYVARSQTSRQGRDDADSQDFVVSGTLGSRRRQDLDSQGAYVISRPLAFGQTQNHYDESQQTYITAFDWQVQGSERTRIVRSGEYAQIRKNAVDAILTQFGVRRLTPLECERLQGFPDDWTAVDGMKDSPRYRMLGNAVAVPVAEWIGKRIVEVNNDILER